MVLFGVFFVYLLIPYNEIDYNTVTSPTYCSRPVYLTSLVLTVIFLVSVLFSVVLVLYFVLGTRITTVSDSPQDVEGRILLPKDHLGGILL